ncbi:hypothetical protein [Bradyrhizobium forestalis]|uniref:hypothetical protein n=1 Tax=Bradyrhizobium forestalis TaxID=1419263 RepID=UPI0011AFB565|nr:hypothetical protein [Bradyrhizobium forestalis]
MVSTQRQAPDFEDRCAKFNDTIVAFAGKSITTASILCKIENTRVQLPDTVRIGAACTMQPASGSESVSVQDKASTPDRENLMFKKIDDKTVILDHERRTLHRQWPKAVLLQRPGATHLCRATPDQQADQELGVIETKNPRRIASARASPTSVDDVILPVFCPTCQTIDRGEIADRYLRCLKRRERRHRYSSSPDAR